MKICFICVNYNNSKYTLKYIKSILKFKNECFFKIIVVDNASKKNDIKQLEKVNFSELNIIKNKKNVGYFKGLNIGINTVKSFDFDYVVIGNNDLTYDKNFIKELTNSKYDKSIFVIAPNIIKPDGSHQNPHIKNKFNFFIRTYRRLYYSNYYVSIILQYIMNLKKRFIKSYDRLGHDTEQIIFMGYGACYILTLNFFKHFERLDAPNFLMGEEGVLTNQIFSKNGKTLYKPNIIVYHDDHSSIGKINGKQLYYFNKESYEYELKNHKFYD